MHNHNLNSAKSEAELEKLHGTYVPPDDSNLAQTKAKTTTKVSEGAHIAATVDWSWATKPVESQGSCGSCYAFTANSVLEATRQIYEGPDAQAVQLSH